jgi:hypothetical protein
MKLRTIGYALLIAVTAVAFSIGSATTGEAKGKKRAAAAPPPPPAWCPFTAAQPVCAVKGKQKFTYNDACFAAKDGAKVVSNKACAVKAAKKGKGKKAKKGGKKKAAKK